MPNDQIETTVTPSEATPISQAIAKGFGELTETDPVELDFVLYDYINSDALNRLFKPDTPDTLTVIFDVEGWKVYIRHNDTIHITIESDPDE